MLLICVSFMFQQMAFAQEESVEIEEEKLEKRHHIALVMSHAWVRQGRNAEGEKEFLVVPSFSFDYNYWINEKWAIGLHTDFLNENFFVETSKGEILERDRPIAPALMGVFKPFERWVFSIGFGREFADEESFTLTRFSVEYGVELPKDWEVFGFLSQDFRWNAYDVTTLGIGLAKRL